MRYLIIFLAFFLYAKEIINPIPKTIPINLKKAKLGYLLFIDPNLSRDKKIACISCHKPNEGWADKNPVSIGVFGKKGYIQSPTILNSGFNFRQMWNGKAKDLKDQVKFPLNNHHEMDFPPKKVEKYINSIPKYKKMFLEIYNKSPVTFEMIADAIAEFEKGMITPDSKFDLYLKRKTKLTKIEKEGYKLFKIKGCIICHNGVNIGGNTYQRFGALNEYKNCQGDRYEITHDPFDKCVYKVPTLRNIALTAPYFHDGSAKNLEDAIQTMAYYNLGYYLEKDKVKAIEAFLKTLTSTKIFILKVLNESN